MALVGPSRAQSTGKPQAEQYARMGRDPDCGGRDLPEAPGEVTLLSYGGGVRCDHGVVPA
jgi:hypothetical protein